MYKILNWFAACELPAACRSCSCVIIIISIEVFYFGQNDQPILVFKKFPTYTLKKKIPENFPHILLIGICHLFWTLHYLCFKENRTLRLQSLSLCYVLPLQLSSRPCLKATSCNLNSIPRAQVRNSSQHLQKILCCFSTQHNTSAVHVLLSRFYPNFIQIFSWFYPDFFKNSLYPDFILLFEKMQNIFF